MIETMHGDCSIDITQLQYNAAAAYNHNLGASDCKRWKDDCKTNVKGGKGGRSHKTK